MNRTIRILALFLLIAACGSDNKGTVTGNPLVISSSSYQQALTGSEPTIDFSLCVTQLQLSDDAASVSVEARLGLVDLSAADASTAWGEVEVEGEVTFSKMVVELHRDPESCAGAEHSMTFREQQLTRDVELVFTFAPAVTLSGAESVSLAMDNIVDVLEEAYDAGNLNDTDITPFLERFTGDGSAEN